MAPAVPCRCWFFDLCEAGCRAVSLPGFGLWGRGRRGVPCPRSLNAANEEAVAAFLQEKIAFLDIPRVIAKVLDKHNNKGRPTIDEILAADRWARTSAQHIMEQPQFKG